MATETTARADATGGLGPSGSSERRAACSVLAELVGEDFAATAPAARRFLLLEQPGPWRGGDAIAHSDLGVDAAAGAARRTRWPCGPSRFMRSARTAGTTRTT